MKKTPAVNKKETPQPVKQCEYCLGTGPRLFFNLSGRGEPFLRRPCNCGAKAVQK